MFPAASGMSQRLDGAQREQGFRWREVSRLQTYSGHRRGIKPQTPLPREEWMNLRENIVGKLQVSLESCVPCVSPVFTHVFALSCFYSKPPGQAALEGSGEVTGAAREEKGFVPALNTSYENSERDVLVKEGEGVPEPPLACLHPLEP